MTYSVVYNSLLNQLVFLLEFLQDSEVTLYWYLNTLRECMKGLQQNEKPRLNVMIDIDKVYQLDLEDLGIYVHWEVTIKTHCVVSLWNS